MIKLDMNKIANVNAESVSANRIEALTFDGDEIVIERKLSNWTARVRIEINGVRWFDADADEDSRKIFDDLQLMVFKRKSEEAEREREEAFQRAKLAFTLTY